MIPSEALKARVLGAVAATPAPSRRRVRALNALALLSAAGLLVGLFFSLGGLEAGRRPLPYLVATAGGWVAAAALGTWLALGRGRTMAGRPTNALLVVTLAAPVLLFGWQLLWNSVYPQMAEVCAGYHPLGAPCHKLIVAMAVVPFFAFAFMRRFSDAVHPRAAGAALAASSATWAGLAMTLRCECTHPLHVGVGHVLPIVLVALAGVVFGPWLLGVRRGR